MKFLMPLAAALLLTTAARADTAQRLEITTAADVKTPDAEAILGTLLGTDDKAKKHSVSARLLKKEGSSKLTIEVSGATLPADAADKLRAMYPALRDAQIALSTVERAGDGLEIEHGDLSDPKAVGALKQRLQDKLKAEGKTGTVEVYVDKDDKGVQRVRVEVKVDKE